MKPPPTSPRSAMVQSAPEPLTLHDLTKEELIHLVEIHRCARPVETREIARIIWHRKTADAKKAMDAAMMESNKHTGIATPEARSAWFKAQKQWEGAMELVDKAEIFRKKYLD